MKKNMGAADRTIRTLVAAVLIVLNLSGRISGTWAMIAWIVAVVFLATSAVGFCPAYVPIKLSTRSKR